MDSSEFSEPECRVCRCGPEDERPLYHPCLCSGSIGLVHQNCLETWLSHSNKDKCELCSTKYVFVPEYASNTPSVVPLPLVIKSALKIFLLKILPVAFKLLMAVILWLFFVPLWTSWVYRIYFREQTYKDVIVARSSFITLKGDIVSGLVIIGVILLSSIILMSFADFVRLFWGGEGRPHHRHRQRNLPQAQIPQVQAEVMADIPNDFGRGVPRFNRRVQRLDVGGNRPQPQRAVVNDHHFEALRRRILARHAENRRVADGITPRDPLIQVDSAISSAAASVSASVSASAPGSSSLLDSNRLTLDTLPIQYSPKMIFSETEKEKDILKDSSDISMLNSPRESIGCDVQLQTPRSEISTHAIATVSASTAASAVNVPEIHQDIDTNLSMENQTKLAKNGLLKKNLEDWVLDSENSWSTVTSENEDSSHPNKFTWSEDSDEENSLKEISAAILPPADPSLGLRRRTGKLSIDKSLDQVDVELDTPSDNILNHMKETNLSSPRDELENEDTLSDRSVDWDDDRDNNIDSNQDHNHHDHDDNDDDDDDDDDDNNNNNNNDDDWADDLDDNNGNDAVGGADVEVRFALDELLGLRGPHFTIVKHVIWFLTFTGLYLFVFVFFPVSMGSIIVEVISKHIPWVGQGIHFLLPLSFYEIMTRAQKLSEQKKAALCLSDLALTIIGYFTIYTITTCWHHIMSFIRKTMISSLDIYVKFLDNLVIAGKIGALLSVRIFILPLCLGTMILTCFNVIFQFTVDEIVVYLADNLVGCLTFAWTVGISYMLVITLSVLQLREILHPDILSKNIRPQETHSELLHSLVNESGWIHFRRLIVSMLVYLVLLAFVLFVPFLMAKVILVYVLHIPKSEVRVWYFVPELQLPLEVAMGHFTMLTVLEGKKNYIGRFLFLWISFISKKLKVTRFVLPCPMKREVRSESFEMGQNTSTGVNRQSQQHSQQQQQQQQQQHDIRATAILRDAQGNPRVGRPLRRPPPGWDARNHDHQIYDNKVTTRWAWGNEEPSTLEANVAPRIIPKDWIVKSCLLIGLSWLLIASVIVFLVIVPVSIGRDIFQRLCLPRSLHHDPIAFIAGLAVCGMMVMLTKKFAKFGWNRMVESIKRIPVATIRQVLELVLLWNVTHIVFKLILFTAMQPAVPLREIFRLSYIFKLWSSHRLLIDAGVILFIDGGAQFILTRLGLPDLYGAGIWCQQLRVSFDRIIDAISSGKFDEESLQLQSIRSLFVWPFFDAIVMKGGSILMIGWISATIINLILSTFAFIFSAQIVTYTSLLSDMATLTFFNRATTALLACYCVIKLLSQPLISLHQRFYQAIKDENYLTGRKLQNVVGRM